MIFTQSEDNKLNFADYFFTFLLLSQASFPLFTGNEYLIAGVLISGLYSFATSHRYNYRLLFILLFFTVIIILQALTFGQYNLFGHLAFLARIIFAYQVISIVGKHNFIKSYIELIYFFTILGVILTLMFTYIIESRSFFMTHFVPFFDSITINDIKLTRSHFGIYTIDFYDYGTPFLRNSGPFWEAGANGIFVSLALALNIFIEKKLVSVKNFIFIIAILLTQSSGVYPILSIILVMWGLKGKNPVFAFIVLASGLAMAVYLYFELPFLGAKIELMAQSAGKETHNLQLNRFGSARLNIDSFLKSPLWGMTFFDSDSLRAQTGNSGFTNYLAQLGLFGMGFILYTYYLSFKLILSSKDMKYVYMWSAVIVVSIVMGGLSQSIFNKPFFFAFMVIPFIEDYRSSK